MSISTTIKSIQVIMRKDVGVDGDAQRIGQPRMRPDRFKKTCQVCTASQT